MKKPYEKPSVTTEEVFETLAAGCTWYDTGDDSCSPYQGGTLAS